jgi:hypothetical protein
VFFVFVPGEPADWAKIVPMVAGVAITLLIGEALAWRCYEAGKK